MAMQPSSKLYARGALPAAERARLAQAQRLQEQGKMTEAEPLLRQLLQRFPNSFDALNGLGLFACQLGRHADGVDLLRAALSVDSNQADAMVNLARALHHTGQADAALACIDMALGLAPDDDEARLEGAGWMLALDRTSEASRLLEPMLRDAGANAESAFRAGRAALVRREIDEALRCFERSVLMGLRKPDVFILEGNTLMDAGRHGAAAEAFAKALELDSRCGPALRGRGRALMRLRRFEEALQAIERALQLEPQSVDAWNLHGAALSYVNRLEEASESLRRALQIDPNQRPALVNLANVLQNLHRNEDAALVFERLLSVWPDCEYVKGRLLHSKMLICDWLNHDKLLAAIEGDIDAGLAVAEPFGMQGYCDSPARLQRAARTFAAMFHPDRSAQVPAPIHRPHEKIRIGYVSGEFRQQAAAILIVNLLELHDKSRFEVFAFDNGRADQSTYRRRIEAAVTEIVPIAALSDDQALGEIRQREIDILVNLNGYFGQARTDLFSLRPAPVQVNFLDFPGTMGVPYMDYLIADPVVMPPEHREFYDEAVVEMPDAYQPSDARRPVALVAASRRDQGLPETGFVFCNFNNSYKITPEVFAVWMRLLNRVPGSVMWLLQMEDAEVATANLRAEATWCGVDADRIVIAPFLSVEQHIARLRLADLVLDTLPYNAHTTGSDALWAGVPMVTCLGQAFPGRVGASLLSAAGLPELITQSLAEYEALALRLATTPPELAAIRQQLARNHSSAPLFDADRYRRHLEAAYEEMVYRSRAGMPPALIKVAALPPMAEARVPDSTRMTHPSFAHRPHEQAQA